MQPLEAMKLIQHKEWAIMKTLSSMFGNATAGGNETNSTQGMMTSGMQNMSQLQHLKNLVFCSPANEKTLRSLMK
jgi:hypothetical protein